jgi:hypothetical protein
MGWRAKKGLRMNKGSPNGIDILQWLRVAEMFVVLLIFRTT